MSKSPLVILLGLATGALLGWWAGRTARPEAHARANAANPATTAPAKPPTAKVSAVKPERDEVLLARWTFADQVLKAKEHELSVLLNRARAATEPAERRQRVKMVALRYAELNPEAKAEECLNTDQELAKGILQGWGAQDGAAALKWSLERPGLMERNDASEAVIPEFAQANPLGLLQMTEQVENQALEKPEVYQAIFSSLARRDPAAAIAKLASVKNPYMREQGYAATAESWAHRDAPAAFAWAKSLTVTHERANALQGAVRVLAESDPRAAIQALDLIDPEGKPSGESPHAAIAASLARLDLAEATKWVKSLDPTKHEVEAILSESIVGALPEVTATSLVTLFQGVDAAGQQSDFSETINVGRGLQSILLQWRPANLGAALQEALTLPSCEARQSVLNYLSWRLAKENPAQALSIAASAPPALQERLSKHLANLAAEQGNLADFAQALNFTTEPTLKLALTREAAERLALHHPEQAAEFLRQLPPDAQPAAAAKLIPILVLRDPDAALALGETLPEEWRALHTSLVATEWAKVDAPAALRWTKALPAGTTRDAASAGAVSALYQEEPQSVYALARGIEDREMRVSQLQAVFGSWRFKDAGAAQLAIASSGLTADELKEALTPPPDGHPNPAVRDRDLGTDAVPEEAATVDPTAPK